MRKIQSNVKNTWRVYMFFPSHLYFKLKRKAPIEGYTKRELDNDHHVKDYIVSLLESLEVEK
jgi:hypothetical protein